MGPGCLVIDGTVGVLMARTYTYLDRVHRPSDTARIVGAPWGDGVADNFDFFLRGRPAVNVSTGSFSVPHTTVQPVTFDTEHRDNYAMFDPADGDHITIPIDGAYTFGGYAAFSTSGFTSLTRGLLQIANVTASYEIARSEPNVDQMVFTALNVDGIMSCNAGDEIELAVYHQGSGVNHTMTDVKMWAIWLRGGGR